MGSVNQGDITLSNQLLYKWLKKQISETAIEWLDKKIELVKNSSQRKDIFLAFSSASRFVGKKDIVLSSEDLKEAQKARKGWIPEGWTADEAARIYFILLLSQQPQDFFLSLLKQLFETAEVAELRALYLGLPLYPYPEEIKARATEGFRTNINIVFNAIALKNPYPKEFLDEAAWNQMILKAVFIGSPLYKIQGIDERANPILARILADFAHERWAASRPVTPELWRQVGPFINEKTLHDLEKVITTGSKLEKQAAALALSASQFSGAKELLSKYPKLKEAVVNQEINWEKIGEEWGVSNQ